MSLHWFRCHVDIVDDEKLGLLAFEDRWHFVAILACKAKGLLDQSDEFMRRKVQRKLGLTVDEFEKAIERLARVKLIDKDTLEPLNWAKRQYASDSSAERTRRYRERLKQGGDGVKRHGDVTVTPPETDTDTDTDTERESKKRARNVRLPSDWMPSVQNVEFCQRERPDLNPGEVANRFRDHWLGNGEAKRDWDATWRNWVRREKARASSAKERTQSWIESLTAPTRSLT